jgi:hypothetical protein
MCRFKSYPTSQIRRESMELKQGDTVQVWSSQTNNGNMRLIGVGQLVEKVGDIPHYWKVRMVNGDLPNQSLLTFVRPEDKVGDPKESPGPKFTIIQGGKHEG